MAMTCSPSGSDVPQCSAWKRDDNRSATSGEDVEAARRINLRFGPLSMEWFYARVGNPCHVGSALRMLWRGAPVACARVAKAWGRARDMMCDSYFRRDAAG